MKELHSAGLKTIFLDGGTLLGAIREGAFISHDKDIDVGCYNADFQLWSKTTEFRALLEVMKKKGYAIERTNEQTIKFKLFLRGVRYKLDVFCFEKGTEYYWHKGMGGIMTYPLECLDTLQPYRFYDVDVMIPNEVEKFLVNTYGANWKIPKPDFSGAKDYSNFHTLDSMRELLEEYNRKGR
jgi:hypothetical protein